MRSAIWILVTGGLVLPAVSCGVPIRGGSYFEGELTPERYVTFAWDEHGDTDSGDPRLRENAFFEDRLHAAIERELLWRGIRYEESAPALRVHHHTSVEDHVLVREAVEESGYTSTEVYEYEEGAVLVHLIDARTGASLWLGWAQANIEPAFVSPAAMTRWVDRMVDTMFEDWPGPTRVDPDG